MKMRNGDGREIYYNAVEKHGKVRFVMAAADGKPLTGRDKQKQKSRTFAQEKQAEAWISRNGFKAI